MKRRCPKCKYKDTDSVYDPIMKMNVDLKHKIRCYRVNAPDIELCPNCKEVL